MDPVIPLQLIVIGVLLVCSCYFSGVETTLLSLPRQRVHRWAQDGGLLGRAFRMWEEHPNRFLTAILIGNNTVNITASVLAAYLALRVSEQHGFSPALTGTVTSAAVTAVIIVFGEILPKVTARAHAVLIAPWVILPIYAFETVLSPLTWLVSGALRWVAPKAGASGVATVTEEDIKLMAEMGRLEGTVDEEETRMIHSIFGFSDKRARDVMVPRTDIAFVDMKDDLELLAERAMQSGYSRLPVVRGDLDHIVGILFTRDLLSVWKHRDLIVLQDILRKPFFIPETMQVDGLLHEFKRGKIQMAVVVDEYGGTAGLVTLEDLVTEIIGDIRAEKEGVDEEGPIVRQPDGSHLIDATVSLDEVNRTLGLHLAARGEVASLGGYILDRLGRLPRKGRALDDVEAILHIADADDRSILRVRLVKREKPLELKPASERRIRRRREKKSDEPAPPPPAASDPPSADPAA